MFVLEWTKSVRFPASAVISLQKLCFVDTFAPNNEWNINMVLIAADRSAEIILVVVMV